MATNTLLTNDIILKSAMMHLENSTVMLKLVDHDFEPEFASGGAKAGDTIRLARPIRGQVREGATMQAQDITEGRDTLTVASQIGADLEFTSKDLTLSVDKFEDRIIKPQMIKLANYLDVKIMTELANKTYNWVGTPGQVIDSYADFAKGPQRLDECSAPDERVAVLSPGDHWSLVPTVAGLYIQDTAKTALTKAKLPMVGNVDMYMSQNVIAHTNGNWASGTVEVNNGTLSTTYAAAKDTWEMTLSIDGLTANTGTVLKGDVFTIEGVYAVNTITGEALDFLQQFVVKEDETANSSGEADVVITPPIITSGPYKTCSTAAVDGADITFKGTKATSYRQNVVFNKNAITVATPPMVKPQGAAWCEVRTYKGVSLRLIQGYDGINDKPWWRFDMLYGVKCYQPWLACRVSGT